MNPKNIRIYVKIKNGNNTYEIDLNEQYFKTLKRLRLESVDYVKVIAQKVIEKK